MCRADSVRGADPEGIGIEEEEEDHSDGHQVHVDEQEHAAVVEAPAGLHAPDGVGGTDDGEKGRNCEEEGLAILREV